jgi:hypothetical protein
MNRLQLELADATYVWLTYLTPATCGAVAFAVTALTAAEGQGSPPSGRKP